MPPVVAAAVIVGAATVTGAAVAAHGAKKAAKTAAEAQQEAIAAQERAAAEQRTAAKEAVIKKEEALKEFKLPGILETPEGARLKGTLEERMAGIGVGYRPEVLRAETAATAAQTRAGLREQTIPAITAAASARGLGRSTIPVSQIGQATQAAERDIESRIAQLQTASEAQKAVDIQNALAQYGGLASEQTRAKQLEAEAIRTGKFDIADTNISAATSRLASSATVSELIASGGKTQAAYELQQTAIWGSAIQQAGLSMSQAYTKSNEDIINAITKQQQENAARVSIAGATASSPSYRLLPIG